MPPKLGRDDGMAGSPKLPFLNLAKSSANVFWKRAIDCYTGHAVSRMSEPLEVGFRFTHALEGGRVAGLHVDRSDFPRVITHRVPESAMVMLHISLLDVRVGLLGLACCRSFLLPKCWPRGFRQRLCRRARGCLIRRISLFRGPLVSCKCGRPGARTGRQKAVGLDRPGARPLMAHPG